MYEAHFNCGGGHSYAKNSIVMSMTVTDGGIENDNKW